MVAVAKRNAIARIEQEWRERAMKAILFFGKAVVALIIAVSLLATLVPPFLDRIYYEGAASTHFDGERFFNPDGEDTARMPTKGSRGNFAVRWLTGTDDREVWPDNVAVKPQRSFPPLAEGEMRATWVGHATVLVEMPGLTVLTDPIWSERSGPFGIGPKRVTEPGIRFEDLPKVDLIVVSHNHYDHMDLDTVQRLWERDKPLIVTPLGNETLIRRTGAKVTSLDWGKRITIRPGIDVAVTRNHHWSSRWFTDRNRALWASFVVTHPSGNLFFAGDTGYGDGKWAEEARAFGPVRLALIPIGAFRFQPGQMEIGSHIGPIKAERIFAGLRASYAIPIHWGTFQLSNEARETPPKMLTEVMKCTGYRDISLFATKDVGVSVMIPPFAEVPTPPAPDAACLKGQSITGLK
jgi:L-ascorbate metabolism protein UlaG (beta-lactamase superfamily)